ncbi:helix-turn-helix domain-containing protein [Algibacter sp. PT7-4]|uniref:helix-turn-helix domain-containing protein n=1 Tax=Algibacter ulvanivorans TaxID=3400999 RepID=UPI003AAE88A2
MLSYLRILILICLFMFISGQYTFSCYSQTIQIDSLIKEKNINKDMTQLELLVLYEDAVKENPKDSIEIFRQLAILNADLDQPEDALLYTEKYISNTLDFSILNDGAYTYIAYSEAYQVLKDKYLQKFNFLVFLFFYVALIGFFFTIIINFSKTTKKQSRVFISGFVAVHSLFLLEYVLYISNLQYDFPHTYLMASIPALSYGPLLYFYFKSVAKNYVFRTKDLLHFLPNALLIIYLLPMYMQSGSDKIRIMLGLNDAFDINLYVIFLSKVLSLAIYALLIWKMEYGNKQVESLLNTNKPQSINWKKNIYIIHVAYVISYIIYGLTASGIFNFASVFLTYTQITAMSVMVIYICFMAYVQPSVFKNEFVPIVKHIFPEKYQKSGLTNALSNELKENLIKLLVDEKVYKQSNINLEILAQKLNTTRHNTSQIINEHFKMNFFELINKFRIEEAQRLLTTDTHGNLNIIDIAYEVGYNNKVTFNKAFKKETKLTPSGFIQTKIKN